MPSILTSSGPNSFYNFDPGAQFNAINAHEAPPAPQPLPRDLKPEGDPVALQEIRDAIQAGGGRITFGQYMDIALYGNGGYYAQGKVGFQGGTAGDAGDFDTSPERSADFSGAISVGVCAIFGAMAEQPFNLLELGAGSGRMTKDVLAAMRNEDPRAYSFVHAYIADYGGMSARQRRVIGSAERAHPGSYAAMSSPKEHEQDLSKVLWIPGSALDSELVRNGRPTIAMSNEVPDAVKTEVVRNNQDILEQKYVGLNENDRLTELWDTPTDEILDYIATYGTVIEPGNEAAISPDVVALQRRICRLITRGGWINIDYSHEGPRQFQSTAWASAPVKMQFGEPIGEWYTAGAVRTYPPKYNPLQMSGELDLTHDPDFTVQRRVGVEEGMTEAFYGTQGELLHLLGVPTPQEFEAIRSAHGNLSDASIRRITAAQGLHGGSSSSFRALVLTRGVKADFRTKRLPLPQYRGFYGLSPEAMPES